MLDARHSREPDLQRDGDVAFRLLGAPAVGLGDELDHRRHGVGICLDVERLVRSKAQRRDNECDDQDDERHAERARDDFLNHRVASQLAGTATVREALCAPLVIASLQPQTIACWNKCTHGDRCKVQTQSGPQVPQFRRTWGAVVGS